MTMNAGNNDIILQSLRDGNLELLLAIDRKKIKTAFVNFQAVVLLNLDCLDLSDADEGLVTAFRCLQQVARLLYNFDPRKTECSFTQERWRHMLDDQIQFGMIKETLACGTSSVSQGVAHKKFKHLQLTSFELPPIQVLLNGGTGGVKAQIYWQDPNDKITRCLAEIKELACNPNPQNQIFPHAGYKPSKKGPDADIEERYLAEFMHVVSQRLAQIQTAITSRHKKKVLAVYCAFVTGPLREHWETGNAATMEIAMRRYWSAFSYVLPWDGQSFFMAQKMEGDLEQVATKCMYKQLYQCKLVSTPMRIVETWGKGRGSVQMGPFQGSCAGENGQHQFLCEFKQRLETTHHLAELFYKDWYISGDMPIIALKSQFALLYEQSPTLRGALVALSQPNIMQAEEVKQKTDSVVLRDVADPSLLTLCKQMETHAVQLSKCAHQGNTERHAVQLTTCVHHEEKEQFIAQVKLMSGTAAALCEALDTYTEFQEAVRAFHRELQALIVAKEAST